MRVSSKCYIQSAEQFLRQKLNSLTQGSFPPYPTTTPHESTLVESTANLPKGLPGRLTKGAGTHLASWRQESTALTPDEAQILLDSSFSVASSSVSGQRALEGLFSKHGKIARHTHAITSIAYSGDILVTKDLSGMRLWRAAGDFALLRCVASTGPDVVIHESGQFIVTGKRGSEIGSKGYRIKIWGPAGGSAFSAGKKSITMGVRRPTNSKTNSKLTVAKRKMTESEKVETKNLARGDDLKSFIAAQRKKKKNEEPQNL